MALLQKSVLDKYYSQSNDEFNIDKNIRLNFVELEKQKITLSLIQQDEWDDYFNTYKTEIKHLQTQVTQTDNEIDAMVCIGGSIGKSFLCDKKLALNQQMNFIRPVPLDFTYVYFCLNNNQKVLLEKSTGSTTPIINSLKWKQLSISTPQQKKQKRIVKKVTQLLKLCDTLKQNLKTQQATVNHLSDEICNIR